MIADLTRFASHQLLSQPTPNALACQIMSQLPATGNLPWDALLVSSLTIIYTYVIINESGVVF